MSSRRANPEVEDVWSKLLRERRAAESGANNAQTATSSTSHSQIVFLGDAGSGKSTLIQTFLKPSAATGGANAAAGKESKPTVALDYNFARKATSTTAVINNNNNNNNSSNSSATKSIAHFWECGGDLTEPQFLEIPLTSECVVRESAHFIIVCDLSKPHNAIVSLLRSLSAIREAIALRSNALQAKDVSSLKALREKILQSYNGHPDSARVKPTDVPIVIVANKHDALRAWPAVEKKALFQTLRFIAHYFGAALCTMSASSSSSSTTNESGVSMRDMYRNLLNAIAFGANGSLPTANYKPCCETNVDKGVFISRGQDSFEQILLGVSFGEDAVTGKVKVKCVSVCLCACIIFFLLSL